MKQEARQKTGESEALASHLHSVQLHMREMELTMSASSTQKKQADRYNKELIKQQDALKQELYKNQEHYKDLAQQEVRSPNWRRDFK
jgi:hypothetical protein